MMRHGYHRLLLTLAAAATVAGCGGDNGMTPATTGTVSGQVVAADNTTPIPGAALALLAVTVLFADQIERRLGL